MFKSLVSPLWLDGTKCWWKREIEHRRQRTHMATWLYGTVGLPMSFYMLCVCVCSRVCTIVLCFLSHRITRTYHNIHRVMVSSAVLPPFPKAENPSQQTKSCQITVDSYRSISSTETCQLCCGGDYTKGLCDSPISRLWGSLWISALSNLLWCLFSNTLSMVINTRRVIFIPGVH